MTDYLLRLNSSAGDSQHFSGTAIFPASHPAFDGHFPGNPLLPAFLHVQMALDLLATAGRPAGLLRMEAAKFLQPIRPAQELTVHLTAVSLFEYDVEIAAGGEVCSRFHLAVQPMETQDLPPC